VSEAAARLPSAIFALVATLAMAWLAWRVYGADTARWLLLLLPTTVGMIGFSHAAATDMPFSAMLTIAMVYAAVIVGLVPERSRQDGAQRAAPLRDERGAALRGWLTTILFGFFLGLAVLAKGPAGIVLCGGAVFFWALFTKRWRDAVRLFHPAAIAAFCATALPWYILVARRNPDFFRIFLIEHNFKRYLTPEFQHIQPFWFYVPIVLVAFVPWTALLLWSIFVGPIRAWRSESISPSVAYFLSWAVFCIAFFSTSQSKLPGYILPSIPSIGVLLAYSYAAIAPNTVKSFRLTLLSAAISLIAVFAFFQWSVSNVRFGIAASVVAAGLGIANLILAIAPIRRQSHFDDLTPAYGVIPVLLIMLLAHGILDRLFPFDPSGKDLARELQLWKIPSDQLAVYGMSRGQHYSLNFYLRQEVREWDRDHPTEGYVLTASKHCKPWADLASTCEQVPFNLRYDTGRFLYRVSSKPSPAHPPSSRQPQ
jgi:4-amino-4-deoxy-L-arabinose transferase-like glycosyltransferase